MYCPQIHRILFRLLADMLKECGPIPSVQSTTIKRIPFLWLRWLAAFLAARMVNSKSLKNKVLPHKTKNVIFFVHLFTQPRVHCCYLVRARIFSAIKVSLFKSGIRFWRNINARSCDVHWRSILLIDRKLGKVSMSKIV